MGRRIVRTSSQDLKKLLLSPTGGRFLRPLESFDEVFPGILLGDASTALSTCLLKELKVTHVLNAAYGKNDEYYGGFVNTSFSNYEQAGIKFMGIPALDTPSFYLRSYFRQAADFIETALRSKGKVLIHCQCGISRSATLIAAYLMLKKGMDAQEALSTIRKHRSIYPNQGFLSQLCDFEYEMKRNGDLKSDHQEFDLDFECRIKDPVYNPAFHSDRRPMFSSRNYTPILERPISRGGYPLSSTFYDYATKSSSRARSEERAARSLYDYNRSRSASPPPSSLRTYRATSVMPETRYYEERPREIVSAVPRTKYIETGTTSPVLTSYESSAWPHQRVYYYTRTKTEPFIYTPRSLPKPVTNAYMRSRYVNHAPSEEASSLTRTLTPRDSTYSSLTPYESYSYTSPYGHRSYSTYTPIEVPPSRSRSSLGSPISASLRYPVLYPATFRHSYLTGLKAC